MRITAAARAANALLWLAAVSERKASVCLLRAPTPTCERTSTVFNRMMMLLLLNAPCPLYAQACPLPDCAFILVASLTCYMLNSCFGEKLRRALASFLGNKLRFPAGRDAFYDFLCSRALGVTPTISVAGRCLSAAFVHTHYPSSCKQSLLLLSALLVLGDAECCKCGTTALEPRVLQTAHPAFTLPPIAIVLMGVFGNA